MAPDRFGVHRQQTSQTRTDRFGDPLPPGALARLGTMRFRGVASGQMSVVFTRDGKGVITAGQESSPRLWEVPTGHYRLHTDQGDDGALVGQHRVCIVDSGVLLSRLLAPNSDRDRLPKELAAPTSAKVPPRYARRDETPLRAEVRPGEQVIDLEVK